MLQSSIVAMIVNQPQPLHFDEWQGRNEQRSEAYLAYAERVAQILTQPDAKNISGAASSACRQANVVQRLWDEI